ncbi:Mur ligase family protein [Salinispora mooreana]|uniref:Mur ligase family protein n=1 Tax=Salinispora mooreana TaxID=999545 RepID=UPI001CC4BD3E
MTAPVVFDSRRVEAGGMFVALPGERVDGHDFAAQAVEAGAAAVLASRPVGVPAVVVEDVPTAYGRLARAVVDRLPQITVIGVTGSVGKTSTKDVLAQVLPVWGATVANRASNNNELGLPYTVTRATADTRYLVLEMGARGIGHVAYLTRIAPPTVSVVTRVGHAHLGEFGSVENIAQVKGEIVEATVALGLGHPIEAVADTVSQAEAVSPGRMQVSARADGVTVTSDRLLNLIQLVQTT